MATRRKRRHSNPEFRHRVPGPLPSVAEVEAELYALLTPALLAPRQLERRDPRNPERRIRLRARILTLPVMVALVVSLVWRRLGAIAEVQRVLAQRYFDAAGFPGRTVGLEEGGKQKTAGKCPRRQDINR